MRWALGLIFLGCGELEGATPYVEAGPSDTGKTDTVVVDAAPPGLNDIDGYYVDEAIPKTLAIYRLDRTSDPAHPRIVIISSNDKAKLGCDLFKTADWNTRMPAGSMIHVIELGGTLSATFKVRVDSPPAADGALVGRTFQSTGTFSLEKATKGTVTIESATPTQSKGSLEATFVVYYDPDPTPQENVIKATFVATSCAVD